MRFLADAGIPGKTVDFLRSLGHDAVHVRELLLQRAADRELVDRAMAESRICSRSTWTVPRSSRGSSTTQSMI